MIKVLDHGYVKFVDSMGTDAFLAECARMSTDTVATEEQNQRLVERLIRDRHTSPIEFGQLVFEVQMPIFVMRQWVRHRTGAFNEFSARYSEMPDLYYVPDVSRVQYQSTFNKQGSAEALPEQQAEHFRQVIDSDSKITYRSYKAMVDSGVTRELARIILPVNFYTKVRWTVNLHNLFHFLKLREDPHAQWEIREYAKVVHQIVSEKFPVTTAAFVRYIQDTVNVSEEAIRELIGMGVIEGDTQISSEVRDLVRRYGDTSGKV